MNGLKEELLKESAEIPEYPCNHCGVVVQFDNIQMVQIQGKRYCTRCLRRLGVKIKKQPRECFVCGNPCFGYKCMSCYVRKGTSTGQTIRWRERHGKI